jgi:PIN domain nuclease of toxin-antitoxin system
MNTYILDTHVFLWWLFNDVHLSYTAREIIKDSASNLLISTASAWEIATKHRIGKLPEAASVVQELPAYLQRARVKPLDITIEDSLLAGSMNHAHRDPFDRMIIAQGKIRNLPVITNDPVFQQSGFGISVVF